MNYIDILILLPVLYGAYRGFSKGLIIELATWAALLLGVFLAIKCSGYTERFLQDFLDISSKYLSYIALGVTFLMVAIVVYLLGKMLTKLVDMVALGLVNKLAGMVFGMLKGFVIVCVLLLLTDALDDKFQFIHKEARESSLLFNPFLNFAHRIYNMIRF